MADVCLSQKKTYHDDAEVLIDFLITHLEILFCFFHLYCSNLAATCAPCKTWTDVEVSFSQSENSELLLKLLGAQNICESLH